MHGHQNQESITMPSMELTADFGAEMVVLLRYCAALDSPLKAII